MKRSERATMELERLTVREQDGHIEVVAQLGPRAQVTVRVMDEQTLRLAAQIFGIGG